MSKKNKERQIDAIKNVRDKQNTYRLLMGRYKRAISNEFYFEAMLIVYGMMEDRLRSFIYHSGGLKNRVSSKFNSSGDVNKKVVKVISTYLRDDENDSLGLKNIKNKMKIVRCLTEWASTSEEQYDDEYLMALKRQYESVDPDVLLGTLNDMLSWLDYRNEVIHGVLNKNMDSLNDNLSDKVEEGMKYARELNNQCRLFKKGNDIRRQLRLQNN